MTDNMKLLDVGMLTDPTAEITTGTTWGLKTTVAWTAVRNVFFLTYQAAIAEKLIIEYNPEYVYLTGGYMSLRPMGYIYPKRIKNILAGETNIVTEAGYSKQEVPNRQVGDSWTDGEGKQWIQRKGFVEALGKYGEYRKPLFCPNCKKIMNKHLDDKYYNKRGKCMNCVVADETQMRIDGTYEAYENNIIKQNAISFLKESKTGILEYLETLKTNKMGFIAEDGVTEKWEGNPIELREFLQKELDDIEKKLIELESDSGVETQTENTESKELTVGEVFGECDDFIE